MSAATQTGAELKARRGRLGLSESWIEGVLDGLNVGVGAHRGSGTNGRSRRRVAEGGGGDWYDDEETVVMRTTYAAALTAEEQRQAREALERGFDIGWARRFRPELACAWDIALADSQEESAAYDAILAALREAAGEPAQPRKVARLNAAGECVLTPPRTRDDGATWYVATREDALLWGYEIEPEQATTPLTEPVAPEGVTVRTVTDCKCTYVSINRGCRDDLIATVWHSDARAVSIEDEYATPEALRFIADLADFRAAQYAAGERQRKLDAVRAAEEALRVADGLCVTTNKAFMDACDASSRAAEALAAAKREAGL